MFYPLEKRVPWCSKQTISRRLDESRWIKITNWVFAFLVGSGIVGFSPVRADSFEEQTQLLQGMAGCYLVDYNYHETESLKEGYTVDSRVYDPNRVILGSDGEKGRSVQEWIEWIPKSEREFRLQHYLFQTSSNGQPEGMLRHQAEDWVYEASHWYDFENLAWWKWKAVDSSQGTWLRKITHLDDGPRYQCSAAWDMSREYPVWSCNNFAPIPGRETRDMKRKDYQALDRTTTLVAYKDSWLERQVNIKTIVDKEGRTPLAREIGKNWYIRVDDKKCSAIKNWVAPRREFWSILMGVWEGIYEENKDIRERQGPPRFLAVMELEEKYAVALSKGEVTAEFVRQTLDETIRKYLF